MKNFWFHSHWKVIGKCVIRFIHKCLNDKVLIAFISTKGLSPVSLTKCLKLFFLSSL